MTYGKSTGAVCSTIAKNDFDKILLNLGIERAKLRKPELCDEIKNKLKSIYFKAVPEQSLLITKDMFYKVKAYLINKYQDITKVKNVKGNK